MFDFWFWLDILGTLEMVIRYTCQLIFWLGVILFLILWLKGISGGYEKMERQFEEDNIRGKWAELKAKKTTQRGKNGKRKTF